MGTRTVARKSLHWNRGLPAGHRVQLTDLICLRPGNGLPPARLEGMVGRPLLREVKEGAMVTVDDLATDSRS